MATRTPRVQLLRSITIAAAVNAAVFSAVVLGEREVFRGGDWVLSGIAMCALVVVTLTGIRRARALPEAPEPAALRSVQRSTGGALLASSLMCLFAASLPALRVALSATGA